MHQEQLIELEFVTSLLADTTQIEALQDITPQMIEDPNLSAIYSIVHASQGRVTQSTLLDDLLKSANGRKALAALGSDLQVGQDPKDVVNKLFMDGIIAGSAEILAERIRDYATQRWIRTAFSNTKPEHYPTSADYAMSLVNQLTGITSRTAPNASRDALETGAREEFQAWQRQMANPSMIEGIKVNLGNYDNLMGGLKPEELIMIGGHSGEGKTQLMCHMAMEAARTPRDFCGTAPRVAYFSLEMSKRQISARWISKLAQVSMREKYPTNDQKLAIENATKDLIQLSSTRQLILIEPQFAHSIDQIVRETIRLRQQEKVEMIFIDYAQLIGVSGNGSKYDQLGMVSKQVKKLCNDLGLTVVMGVQLNRDALTGGNSGRPAGHHIADSLDLLRAADALHLIWNPARHMIGDNVGPWNNIAVLMTEKLRNREQIPWQYYYYRPAVATFEPVSADVQRVLASPESRELLKKNSKFQPKTPKTP